MPSADSCGDPFQEKMLHGYLPLGCGAEAVLNYSLDKVIRPSGSGDSDDYQWPDTTAQTTVLPGRKILSTPSHRRTVSVPKIVAVVSVAPNRSSVRLPPRFMPDQDIRHSSFQHLLRSHLNTFNQRLSMLESNTLDMRESIIRMEDQQSLLSSQLKELIAFESTAEKTKKVGELEKGYTDMEERLSRLEGRLEILIDGFTALAQEMNKLKRTRHTTRSSKEKLGLPSLSTVLVPPMYSTPRPAGRRTPTRRPLVRQATVPKSIPAPNLRRSKPPRKDKHVKVASSAEPQKHNPKLGTPQSKSHVSHPTRKAKGNVNSEARSQFTSTAKPEKTRPHISRSNPTRSKQVPDEAAITKFQLEPPSHTQIPARTPTNRAREKAFRADEPLKNHGQSRGKVAVPTENPAEVVSSKIGPNATRKAKVTVAKKRKTSTKATLTPVRAKATPAKKLNTTTKGRLGPPRTTKKPNTPTKSSVKHARTKATKTAKKHSSRAKAKPVTKSEKKTRQKDKTNTRSELLELLKLLKGEHTSAKQKKNNDGSLHVVLGRLAIPVRILPDE